MKRGFVSTLVLIASFFLMAFSPSKRVSVEVYDTDVKGVLVLLSESQGLNLVCSDKVKGKVTLKLRNVPWIRAMDTVSSIVPMSWKVEAGTLYVFPKKRVEEERVLSIVPLSYSSAKDVAERVSKLLSEGGRVDVDERTNSIIVYDRVENVKKIRSLIKVLDKKVKEILVQAKIISVDYSHMRDIGIQWGGYYYGQASGGKTRYGTAGSTYENEESEEGGGGENERWSKIDAADGVEKMKEELEKSSNVAVNLPANAPTSSLFFTFGKLTKSEFYRINMRLSALIRSRNAEVVSEPKVLTIDNKPARIGQGVEIPYQTVSDEGTKTEFRKAELSLYVKPRVNANGDIFLDVTVTRDSIGAMTTDAGPTINTQRVNTSLLLKDGETAVIGGIVENSRIKEVERVPILSKIPGIGRLFKRKMKDKSKREMLIFITPKVLEKES